MLNIHWSWLVFVPVVIFMIYKLIRSSRESGGDYSFDFETPFWFVALVAYVLIWGGFFWW
jgi:hypothetical protein